MVSHKTEGGWPQLYKFCDRVYLVRVILQKLKKKIKKGKGYQIMANPRWLMSLNAEMKCYKSYKWYHCASIGPISYINNQYLPETGNSVHNVIKFQVICSSNQRGDKKQASLLISNDQKTTWSITLWNMFTAGPADQTWNRLSRC